MHPKPRADTRRPQLPSSRCSWLHPVMTFRAPLVTRRGPGLVSFPRDPSPSRCLCGLRLRAVCLVVPLICLVSPAPAQLIPIKTIPIAQGDQFQIFPSNNMGMGGVSIALPDSLGDPFANPATTARLRASRFFSAPTVYSVSGKAGGGRSLPFAMLTRRTKCTAASRWCCNRSTRVAHRNRMASSPWTHHYASQRADRQYPVPIYAPRQPVCVRNDWAELVGQQPLHWWQRAVDGAPCPRRCGLAVQRQSSRRTNRSRRRRPDRRVEGMAGRAWRPTLEAVVLHIVSQLRTTSSMWISSGIPDCSKSSCNRAPTTTSIIRTHGAHSSSTDAARDARLAHRLGGDRSIARRTPSCRTMTSRMSP